MAYQFEGFDMGMRVRTGYETLPLKKLLPMWLTETDNMKLLLLTVEIRRQFAEVFKHELGEEKK